MSVFVRLREMVTAHSHHVLDQAENPHVMAQQILRDLGEDLARAHQALVTAVGAVKALERQQEQARAESAQWRQRAERMLAQHREDLARGALDRALTAEAQIAEQEAPLASARATATRLRQQVDQLRSEWDAARAKCAQIAANQNAAEVLGAAGRLGDHYARALDRVQRLDRLSRTAAEWDCRAEAATELLGERQRLDRELQRSDRDVAVNHELAALKARLQPSAEG